MVVQSSIKIPSKTRGVHIVTNEIAKQIIIKPWHMARHLFFRTQRLWRKQKATNYANWRVRGRVCFQTHQL